MFHDSGVLLDSLRATTLRKLHATKALLISQLPQMLPCNCLEKLWENQGDLLLGAGEAESH